GGAHVACEEISNVAAKLIEDARIGLSPLEKSTRYVTFTNKVHGQYRYVREATIMQSRWANAYESTLDNLFDTYSGLLEPTMAWVRARTPRDTQTTERAYNSATRAKAFDILRGLLPMATRTNVGLFGNGRAFEYLITRLGSHDMPEMQQISDQLQQALDGLIPSFVKRAKTPRGSAMRTYMSSIRKKLTTIAGTLPSGAITSATPQVTLVRYDDDALLRVASAALYPHTSLSLSEVHAHVATLPHGEQVAIIAAAAGDRAVRFHKPGRAFEEAHYTFDIIADIGAYRDLQRHRILTQTRQPFGGDLGYMVPPELKEALLEESYCVAIERASDLARAINNDLGEVSQYVVPMACLMRWQVTLNLREAYHLCELRSSPQGHPTYRAVAQQIYQAIASVHPELAAHMHFVDLNDYELERLDAERRLDKKLAK
ncbi:MAG: FAD-dependent thymidylate synthase, partial [Chloroflexales bacterium]|nr:FAD-dependent thymidylate synthase [Chloroflexales bacterium]